jgi:hypothetical protein
MHVRYCPESLVYTLRQTCSALARLTVAMLCLSNPAYPADNEPIRPENRQAAEIFSQLRMATDIWKLSSDQFHVTSTMLFDGTTISARTLKFDSGAVLTISDTAVTTGPIFIVTDTIELNGPARITWSRRDTKEAPPDRNRAPDGSPGRGDGSPGGAGAAGQQGNVGYPGRSAPSIILFARSITGTAGTVLSVDLSGEQGGPGGRGQQGGRGGDGAKGSPASQSLFDCKAGPGRGGDGGNGGDGGAGGPGGSGGNGGDILVAGLDENDAKRIEFRAAGGDPGSAGAGGKGGDPGLGGSEGEVQLPFCRPSSRRGSDGKPGADFNDTVQPSTKSAAGRYIVVPLSVKQFTTIFQ